MSKKLYFYDYSDYRIYKCVRCGRTMVSPQPHYCNGEFRKHNLEFITKQTDMNERFDPKTLHPFDKVLVRVDKNDCWMAAHFSHVDDYTHKAVCDTFYYTQCVPYNEETKHLVGKTEDCPEYYKWWEE